MKCKSCGGEVLFTDGQWICQSCGSTVVLDSIYENIDIYICYEENDTAGRRTKDSIIAAEVYSKLESNKISVFYERVSADGVVGEELEAVRYSAMRKAKAVVVLASSRDAFLRLEEKFSKYFTDKKVIPFCVDINPGDIPKTLSSIQAVNYSSIGWDKDLVNGLYNLLGRKKEVDTHALYASTHKRKTILIVVISLLLAIAVAVTLVFVIATNIRNSDVQTATKMQIQTPQSIFEQATDLMNQGKYSDALELFYQIPDHAHSADGIKRIYDKYEGYYNSGNTTFHLGLLDNNVAEIEIMTVDGKNVVNIAVSSQISVNTIECEYIDNHKNTGKIVVKLNNADIKLRITPNEDADEVQMVFEITDKADQPTVQISKEILLGWLDDTPKYSQVVSQGYTLEEELAFGFADEYAVCRIQYTDIYLTLSAVYEDIGESREMVVLGVAAPAELIAPSKIGESTDAYMEGNLLWLPGRFLSSNGYAFLIDSFSEIFDKASGDVITDSTIIGVTKKDNFHEDMWGMILENVGFSSAKKSTPAQTTPKAETTTTTTDESSYLISVPDDSTIIYDSPSYNGEQVQNLPLGTYTIVEEQYDDNGNLWGKLKSGIGWICLDEI